MSDVSKAQAPINQSEISSLIREEIQRSFRNISGQSRGQNQSRVQDNRTLQNTRRAPGLLGRLSSEIREQRSTQQQIQNRRNDNYNEDDFSSNIINVGGRGGRPSGGRGGSRPSGGRPSGGRQPRPQVPILPNILRSLIPEINDPTPSPEGNMLPGMNPGDAGRLRNNEPGKLTGRTRTTFGGTNLDIPCLDGKCEPPRAVPANPPSRMPQLPTQEQPPGPSSSRGEQPKDGPQQHIGRGHLLTAEEKRTGKIRLRDGTEIDFRQGITREEMEKIYDNDKAKLSDLAKSNIDKKLGAGAYEKLDPNVRAVMDDMAYAGGNAAFKNQKLIDALKSGDREQIAKVVENSLTTARGDTEGKLSAGMIAAAKKRADAVRDPNIDIEQQRRRREGERSHQYDALKPEQDPRGADFEETARRRAGQTTPQAQQQPTQPQQQPTQPRLTEEQKKRIDDVRAKIEAAKRGEGDIQEALRAGEELKKELDRGTQQQQNLTNQPTTAVPVTPAPEGTNLNNVPPTGLPTTAVPVTPVPEGTNLETMPTVMPPSAEQLSPRARQDGTLLNQASLDLKSTKDQQMASMGGSPTIINNNNSNASTSVGGGGDTASPPISSVRNEENSFVRMQNAQAMQFLT